MSKNTIKAIGCATLAGILCLNILSISYAKDTVRSGTAKVPTGSIFVTMRSGEDDEAIPGGSLTLYKVGTYIWINTRYLIQLNDEFIEDYTSLYLEVESLDDKKAQELADRADKTAIEGLTLSIGEDGRVSFDNLGEGLYLITQKEAPQGYLPVKPFFVTIPFFDRAQGIYIYDVDASPKTQKYIRLLPLIPLEPAWHNMAELTPAYYSLAELTPAFTTPIPIEPTPGPDIATPSDATPSDATPSDAIPSDDIPSDDSSSDPPMSYPGAGGSGQSSRLASHGDSGGGSAAPDESLPPDTQENSDENSMTGLLAPTGEGRNILAAAALCLLSGIALAVAVVRRIKKEGR